MVNKHNTDDLTVCRLTALKGRPEFRIPAMNLDSALRLDDMPDDAVQDTNEPRACDSCCYLVFVY